MGITWYTLILLFCIQNAFVVSQECFWPDGTTVAVDHVPCDPDADVSNCCHENDLCDENGYCHTTYGSIQRGSCTQSDWTSPCVDDCPGYAEDRGADLFLCSRNIQYACDPVNPCENSFIPRRFIVRPRQNQLDAMIIEGGFSDRYRNASTVNAISTVSNQGEQPPTATVTSDLCVGDVVSTSNSCTGYSSRAMAGVGAGVGVPLTLGLLGAVYLLLREKKKSRNPMGSLPGSDEDHVGLGVEIRQCHP